MRTISAGKSKTPYSVKKQQANKPSEVAEVSIWKGTQPAVQSSQRKQKTINELKATYASFLRSLAAEELERIARHTRAAAKPSNKPTSMKGVIATASVAAIPTEGQSLRLEFENQQRYFEHRHLLLQNALTSTQVAELLKTSRQTPHDRFKAGSLVAIQDHGRLMFPLWQFDSSGPHGVLPGLTDTVRSLNISPESKVWWLARPNASLDGATPMDFLKRGEIQRVLNAARAVGVS